MKARSIILAFAMLAVSACAKESWLDNSGERQIIITASQEGAHQTKTAVQDGGAQVYWEPGDVIKVFCDGADGRFMSQCTDYSSVTTFTGKLPSAIVGSHNAAAKKIWGLYPYRTDAACDGNSVTTRLESGQTGRAGRFDPNTQITLACSNSFGLAFYNVCGGIRFTLSQSGVRSVVFEGNNNEALAGTVKLVFEGGVPAVKTISDAETSITLMAPNGEYFQTGKWYYIVSLPATLSNGFKMTFHKDSEVGILNSSSSQTIKRGVFGSVENIDKNVAYSAEEAANLLPEIHDGDVVLANNALVEKFLTEVHYPERDYTTSYILDYPPVAPGYSDLPPVYAIKWTADAGAGALSARLVDGDWSLESTLPAGSSFLRVSNLRPGANYSYEVKSAGGKVMASGSFRTTGHLHQLFFQARIRNCRDLGGWPTKDGKTVKYRKVYRGGRLEPKTLTDQGLADVLAEGIKAQLDLRYTNDVLSECALGQGYAFCAPHIEEGYSYMLKDEAKVKECFEFIVNNVKENKPVYFHCSLGRDRTGTMAMIVLGILGVDEGDISKEYELTQFAPNGWATSNFKTAQYDEKTKMTRMADYDSAAQYIWSTYTKGTESFASGMENYLLHIGVSRSDIDTFRSLMLE